MSGAERDDLERRLEALRSLNPAMPAEVEQRVRDRIAVEAQRPTRIRRIPPFPPAAGGTAGQFIVLLLAILISGWVAVRSVLPLLASGGSADHCVTAAVASPKVSVSPAAKATATATPAADNCEHATPILPAKSATVPRHTPSPTGSLPPPTRPHG